MCFSASASFTASGLLILSSIVTLKIGRPSLRLLSISPLFFAIQQASEGIVWLTASTQHTVLAALAKDVFLIFALLFWPLWVPGVILYLEKNPVRKKLAWIPLILGAIFVTYALYYMIKYGGLSASLAQGHIAYATPIPLTTSLERYTTVVLYGLAVLLPGLISSLKKAWILSATVFVGYIVALYWFPEFFTSVWCFFAAISSATIVYIVWANSHD